MALIQLRNRFPNINISVLSNQGGHGDANTHMDSLEKNTDTAITSFHMDRGLTREGSCFGNTKPRGGNGVSIFCATILSCGMGGMNAATGGPTPCYLRCCRVDLEGDLPALCGCCTCWYCCCVLPAVNSRIFIKVPTIHSLFSFAS